MSGLQVNLQKSTIFSSGVTPSVLQTITSTYSIISGTLPVRYLGLPLLTKRMQKQDYQILVDRVRLKLQSWTCRFLSYAGHLQLIKSVISSFINFWISVFRLPKGCITQINGLCSAFLWSGPDLSRHKAKLCWEDVCRPKEEGGLGIQNIKESMQVCTLKLIWRVLSQASQWSKWINSDLLRSKSFWSEPNSTTKGSWIWRKIMHLKPLAKSLHQMSIGNGKRASYWYDHWSTLGRLSDLSLPQGHIALGIPLDSTVHHACLVGRFRQFRTETLSRIMTTSINTFRNLQPTVNDKDLWKFKDEIFKDDFNTKKTWDLTRASTSHVSWSKAIWFSTATPKYSFISWLALHDRLSTGDRIKAWTPTEQIKCIFCGRTKETRNHIFFKCRLSYQVWKVVLGTLPTQSAPQSWQASTRLITAGGKCKSSTFLLRYVFQVTVYHLWRERNSRRHGHTSSPVSLLIRLIETNVRDRLTSLQYPNEGFYKEVCFTWSSTRR